MHACAVTGRVDIFLVLVGCCHFGGFLLLLFLIVVSLCVWLLLLFVCCFVFWVVG